MNRTMNVRASDIQDYLPASQESSVGVSSSSMLQHRETKVVGNMDIRIDEIHHDDMQHEANLSTRIDEQRELVSTSDDRLSEEEN